MSKNKTQKKYPKRDFNDRSDDRQRPHDGDRPKREELPKLQTETEWLEFKYVLNEELAAEHPRPEILSKFFRILLAQERNAALTTLGELEDKLGFAGLESLKSELTLLPPDRMAAPAVAALLAKRYANDATEILLRFSGRVADDGPPYFVTLSKERKEAIKTKFVSPQEGFVGPVHDDPSVTAKLVLLFTEIASEISSFGTDGKFGNPISLLRWATKQLKAGGVDEKHSKFVHETLRMIAQRLPEPARKENEAKLSEALAAETVAPAVLEQNTAAPPENNLSVESETAGAAPDVETSVDVSEKENQTTPAEPEPVAEVQKPTSPVDEIAPTSRPNASENSPAPVKPGSKKKKEVSGFPTAEQLLELKQRSVAELNTEIAILTRLISERDDLKERMKNFERLLSDSYDENEKLGKRLNALRDNFDSLENDHKSVLRERDNLAETKNGLLQENARLSAELSRRTDSLQNERDEYRERTRDEVEFELGTFKVRLGQRLLPILENKRTTDKVEASAELAEFLRDFFVEIEQTLKRNGIEI